MSKSIKKKLMTLMIVGIMAMPMAGFAQEGQVPMVSLEDTLGISTEVSESIPADEAEEKQNEYIKYKGKISQVNKNDGRISIQVIADADEDEHGMVFHISEDVSVWSMGSENLVGPDSFKEGMEVEVYFHQFTPTTMSIPPQLTPQVVVIQDKESHGSTYMGIFNEELTSTDNYLKLNIGEDTLIVNQKGEKLEVEDIYNQTALVFYGISTRSIPAQTTPSKVVVFQKEAAGEIVESTESEEVVDEKEMIPLRETAKDLGYKVKWNNEDKTVELTKQNQTIVVKLGDVDYSLNKSLGKFSKAPELKNGILYVSASILDVMK